MELIKNEFKMNLKAKIKEEQLKWINQNGVKQILKRAADISKDINFLNINENMKE